MSRDKTDKPSQPPSAMPAMPAAHAIPAVHAALPGRPQRSSPPASKWPEARVPAMEPKSGDITPPTIELDATRVVDAFDVEATTIDEVMRPEEGLPWVDLDAADKQQYERGIIRSWRQIKTGNRPVVQLDRLRTLWSWWIAKPAAFRRSMYVLVPAATVLVGWLLVDELTSPMEQAPKIGVKEATPDIPSQAQSQAPALETRKNSEEPLSVEDRDVLERQAADALISGKLDEALVRYRQLALAQPNRPEVTVLTRILEKKIHQ